MEVEVAVLGSPSLLSFMVSVDVKQHERKWGLCSALIISMHNNIHPPEIEVDPLKTAFGCPCGGI